jgi:glycosyltransferase involved in cell wall biosynthesis
VRVAIATDFHSPWIGGPATFIDNFAAYLACNDHTVDVIAPSPSGKPYVERRDNITVRRMATVPMPFGYNMRATARIDRVFAAVRSARPDVMQVHHPFPLGFSAVQAARRLSIPVVAVNHTIPECSLYGLRDSQAYPLAVSAFSRYLSWFLSQADAICTPTSTAATLLKGLGVRRPVEVISNGIDVARFAPAFDQVEARRELGLPNKPTILYTGRLDAEKDMDTWLRAGAVALQSFDAHLVVGGEGTDKARLVALAQRLGIARNVSFPGYLPLARLPRLYQAADVYCITSAVELQSITTLEALASGLPVVAANAGALPELVEDRGNGYLATTGNVSEFAHALKALLGSPACARAMGASGRRRAESHSLGAVAERHEALLRNTATGRPGPARGRG